MNKRLLLLSVTLAMILFLGCTEESPVSESRLLLETPANLLAVAGEQTLHFYDIDRQRWLETTYGLGNAPNWLLARNNNLFVISSLSNSLHRFTFKNGVISPESISDIGIHFNNNPYSMTAADDSTLLITNLLQNSISVFRPFGNGLVDVWDTGIAPEGIVNHGAVAYVINTQFDFQHLSFNNGLVTEHLISTGEIVGEYPVGINAQYAEMDPYGRLHVVCTGDYAENRGEIQILGLDSGLGDTLLSVPYYPGRLAIADWGTVYVACGGWASENDTSGIIYGYDWGNLTAFEPIPVGMGAIDVCVDEESRTLFVACHDANSIDIVRDDRIAESMLLPEPPQALTIWKIE